MAAAPPPRRGKNAARTVSLLLLVLVVVLLITPSVHSRPQAGFSSTSSTISGQKGSELRAWRRDAIWPDRTTDVAPPAPKANGNAPGRPFG